MQNEKDMDNNLAMDSDNKTYTLEQRIPDHDLLVQFSTKTDEHDDDSIITINSNKEDEEFYNRFSHTRRNIMCVIISVSSITAPMTTTIVYPITDALIKNFGTTETVVDACLSVFLVLAGVVPMAWASFSDVYGRKPVYFTSMIIFILSCIGSIFSTNMTVYFITRCFQAIGSSAVLAIGAGSISDIFPIAVRGRAMGMYLCGPLLGPSVGPIIGGFLVDHLGWKSIFYFLLIVDIILFTLINIFLPETMKNATPIFGKNGLFSSCFSCCRRHRRSSVSSVVSNRTLSSNDLPTTTAGLSKIAAPVIVVQQDKENEQEVSTSPLKPCSSSSENVEKALAVVPPEKKSFPNPFTSVKYLKYPFVTLIIIYICAIYGTSYCLTSSLPKIYSKTSTDTPYNYSSTVVGLLYVGIGFGMCMGSLTGGYDSDRLINHYLVLVAKQRRKIIDAFAHTINKKKDCEIVIEKDPATTTTTTSKGYGEISINTYKTFSSANSSTTSLSDKANPVFTKDLNKDDKKKKTKKGIHALMKGNKKWLPAKIPPEYRLKNIYIGTAALVLGLLIHGWTVQWGWFVLIPLMGQLMVGFGQMYTFSITSTYLIEVFPLHSASVTSLNNCLRSIFAALATYCYSPAVDKFHGTGIPFTFLAVLIGVSFFGILFVNLKGTDLRHKHCDWRGENDEAKRELDEFEKQHGFEAGSISQYFSSKQC